MRSRRSVLAPLSLASLSVLLSGGCGLAVRPVVDGGGLGGDAGPSTVDGGLDAGLASDAGDGGGGETDAGPPPYDPTRLTLCQALEPRSVVALSPDGSSLALVGSRSIEIVGTADGRTRRVILTDGTTLSDVLGFTVDGTALVVSEGAAIVRYDVATGARESTPLGAGSAPSAVVVTSTGVVAVRDGVVQEIPFVGARRTIAAVPSGPTPHQILALPSGDLLLVSTEALRRIAPSDGHEVARAAAPPSDGFSWAALLGDGSIVVARYRGMAVYDGSLAPLASFPIVTTLMAAAGSRVLVASETGGASVLDYAHGPAGTSLTPHGTITVDADTTPAGALLAAGTALAVSAPSGAFVLARSSDLAVTLRRDALAIDASAGIALLAPHRVVLAEGVLDLDTRSVVHQFDARATRVLAAERGNLAARDLGSVIELVDGALGTRTLPVLTGTQALSLAPDGSAIGGIVGSDVLSFAIGSSVLSRASIASPSSAVALALAPGGTPAYVAGSPQGLVAVDVPGGATRTVLAEGFVSAVLASSDGRTVAADAAGGLVRIDAETGESQPAGAFASAMAFADESRWLFTSDGASLFAQPADGSAARRRIATEVGSALVASPDGELVVVGQGTSLHVYCTPESSLHP
ncbi:MAG: hypothetical protein U0234_02170 [Sandaracinus sp.]